MKKFYKERIDYNKYKKLEKNCKRKVHKKQSQLPAKNVLKSEENLRLKCRNKGEFCKRLKSAAIVGESKSVDI